MKRNNALTLLVGLLFATVALSAAPAAYAHGSCSTAKAAGDWGFTLSGTATLPTGPTLVAAVGKATIDTEGNATGAEARSVGGNFANETLTGTLTVNSDCTGTITVEFFELGKLVRTSVVPIIFVDNMKEFLGVQESLVLPNGASVPVVITVDAKRIFTREEND